MRQQESVNHGNIINCTTTVITAVVVLIFLFSCSGGTDRAESDIVASDSTAVMSTYGVTTLISDSGRISYKIEAEEWSIFNKRRPPYWSFEKGLYLEKYDRNMNIEATVKCDTAYYFNEDKLWKLLGNIDIKNSKNEKFLVVSGKGVIRFRHALGGEVMEYFVSGDKLEVVDMRYFRFSPKVRIRKIFNLGRKLLCTLRCFCF